MKYKHHLPNSRKGLVHLLYDLYGSQSAITMGKKFGLDPETPGQWISDWKRGDEVSVRLEKRELKLQE